MKEIDGEAIRKQLSAQSRARLAAFDVFAEIASTNTYLSEQVPPSAGQVQVAIADHQTAGRGRRENTWLSAPGDCLCLSLAYTFLKMPHGVPALPLALGVAAARALTAQGVRDVQLKWPNDIILENAKLGGILTESQFRGSNELSIVAGVGINIRVPDVLKKEYDSSWATAVSGIEAVVQPAPQREGLAAVILDEWISAFTSYEQGGFESFENDYQDMDWLLGKFLVVDSPEGQVRGIAAGIDRGGALLVQGSSGQRRVITGTVKSVNGNGKT